MAKGAITLGKQIRGEDGGSRQPARGLPLLDIGSYVGEGSISDCRYTGLYLIIYAIV